MSWTKFKVEKLWIIDIVYTESINKLIKWMNLSPSFCLSHAYIPATHEDYNIITSLWKNDWAKYRVTHPKDQDRSFFESKTLKKCPAVLSFFKTQCRSTLRIWIIELWKWWLRGDSSPWSDSRPRPLPPMRFR